VVEWVHPHSIVYTDEWPAYNQLGTHFAAHSRVRHASGDYVLGDAHANTIEGFFGHLKPSIRGTYRKVSHRWLQGYLNEFTWRYNDRHDRKAMFETLLERAANG
jgi:transposase